MFLILGVLLVLRLGIAGTNIEAERIRLETRITAEQIKLRLESCYESRVGLVRTLSSYPWQSQEQLVADWTVRTSALLPLFTGVQALNYVDTDGIIRVVYPVASNRAALNANLRMNPNATVVNAIERAESTGSMARTNVVNLLQGGKGFVLYRPIRSFEGTPLGLVNGVFRIDDLMNSCLPEGRLRQSFAFTLADDDQVFYAQTDPLTDEPSPYQVELLIDVTETPWQFSIAPLSSHVLATDSLLNEIWVGFGLLLTLLLAAALRFALLKQQEPRTLEEHE